MKSRHSYFKYICTRKPARYLTVEFARCQARLRLGRKRFRENASDKQEIEPHDVATRMVDSTLLYNWPFDWPLKFSAGLECVIL